MITVTTGVYSLEKIKAAARGAVRQGVPVNEASPYPPHSIAHFVFAEEYEAACKFECEDLGVAS